MKNLFVILVLVTGCILPSGAFAFWSKSPVRWTLDTITEEERRTTFKIVKDTLAHPDDAKFTGDFWAVQGSQGHRFICGFVDARGTDTYSYTGRDMFAIFVSSNNINSIVFHATGDLKPLVLNICRDRIIEK